MIYFVSDVHLGLRQGDPAQRENRFVEWLSSLPRRQGDALVMLGDIWDFWYEYRDVVPKDGVRVVAQLIDMIRAGMRVYFVPGNHDIWCYGFFEELGIVKLEQCSVLEEGGKRFVLAHGDGVGRNGFHPSLLGRIFRCRVLQILFSMLHPWIAFRFGKGWSRSNRKAHAPYEWKGESERLYKYAVSGLETADFYIFGHYHCSANEPLPSGARLIVLDDWIKGGTPHAEFDGETLKVF